MTANSTLDMPTTALAAARPALLERLCQRPWEFDFFQAVWLYERYYGGEVPLGQRGPVARERLRFRPDLSLGFPATDVRRMQACQNPDTGELYHVCEIAFLGLYGVSTPLPLHYAVDVLRASEAGSTAAQTPGGREAAAAGNAAGASPVRDFLDIFHHRAISLFYRAWLKYHYERMFGAPARDAITDYLRLLVGCPPEWNADVLGLPPIRLLRYAGVLTQRPRSATTLAGVLFDYWGDIPVRVEQFIGQWVPLDVADQNRIGRLNSRLGADLTVGDQVYDLGGTFNIVVGPVDWATYVTFLPGGPRFEQTRALTRLYCCDPLAFTVEVTLRAGEVPETQLTGAAGAGRLGMTSWVRTKEMPETSVTFTTT